MIWIFALQYALYLVGDVFWDRAIKISALILILVFYKRTHTSIKSSEKNILLIFYLLLLTLLIPALLSGDVTGFYQWSKFAFMTLIFPILLASGNTFQIKNNSLITIYVCLGIAFSIQAIIGFLAIRWNLLEISNIVEMSRRPDVPQISLGLLGFGNAIQSPFAEERVLRPQGWFLEPSILAAFLLFPFFKCLGEFSENRSAKYLLSSVLIFSAIFLTFSLAAYFAIIATLLFAILSKPFYESLRNRGVIKYSYSLLISVIFFFCASGFMKVLNGIGEIEKGGLSKGIVIALKMFSRDSNGPSGNLLREQDRVGAYFDLVSANPLGVGLSHTLGMNDWGSASAFFFWVISGGVPALIFLVFFFGYIFVSFCHPLLISGNNIYKYIAASFIGHSIHNLSYGNWLAPFFLVHLVILIMTSTQLMKTDETHLK